MEIKRMISNFNYSSRNGKAITEIVIHDVGVPSSAYNNAVYFNTANRNASAHYFVDDDNIFQVVEEWNASWHSKDHNAYSIGVEMCLPSGDVSEATENRTVALVKELMARYNIQADKVIRHYDATGKICPSKFSGNDWERWKNFKQKLVNSYENVLEPGVYIFRSKANREMALDLYKDQGNMIVFYEHGGRNQQWRYNLDRTLTCEENGLAVDIEMGSTTKGSNAIVYRRHGGTNQQFIFTKEGYIVNVGSGLVLDVLYGEVVSGARVIQWTLHGGSNQRWEAIKVG